MPLRDIARRLEALEKAAFKNGAGGANGASTAAKDAAPPPES